MIDFPAVGTHVWVILYTPFIRGEVGSWKVYNNIGDRIEELCGKSRMVLLSSGMMIRIEDLFFNLSDAQKECDKRNKGVL